MSDLQKDITSKEQDVERIIENLYNEVQKEHPNRHSLKTYAEFLHQRMIELDQLTFIKHHR